MTGRAGFAVARFLECISRFLQAFANRAFGGLGTVFDGFASGLCTMLDGLACGLCTMFNRLPRFSGGFLNGLACLFDWTWIFGLQDERNAD